MSTTVEIEQVPIDVSADVTRAKEVVDTARHDAHTAIVAHRRLLTIETLAQQVTALEQQIRTDRDTWTDWIRDAVDTSQEAANENDWCGVYDDTMERLGLPRRQAQEVEVSWYQTITLTREISDYAVEELAREDIGDYESLTVTTSAVVEAEVRIGGYWTAPDGDCVCDSVADNIRVRDELPSGFEDWDIESEGDVYCDNCN